MRNYIILNGKNSNQINGLLIQELPPISKPLLRNQIEEIDGRDGDIATPLGYSAYDKEFTIGLYKDFDVNEVASYFNSEGTVIFSNEPDKYYYYQITAQIDFERLVRYRTATVTMHCQPFKYSATEQPITEDVSGTVSDEGTNFALEDTAEAPFNTLDIKGNTFQQNYEGKNLFNKNTAKIVGGYINGSAVVSSYQDPITNQRDRLAIVPCLPNTTYTITKPTTSVLPKNRFRIGTSEDVPVNGSKLNDYWTAGDGTTTTTHTFTTSTTANWLCIFYGQTEEYDASDILQTILNGIQLELGSTATSYEPYVGGVPSPNPDYPQPIQVVTGLQTVEIHGKNLANPTPVPGGSNGVVATYNSETGEVTVSGTVNTTWSNPFKVSNSIYLPAGTYTLKQYGELTNGQITCYTQGYGYQVGASTLQKTFTTTRDGNAYICITGLTAGNSVSGTIKFQLEEGSTATAFVPYSKQTYTLNLGSIELCKLGTYQDYIYKDGDSWKVHKDIGKYQFNGSEPWIRSDLTKPDTFVASIATKLQNYLKVKDSNTLKSAYFIQRDLVKESGQMKAYNGTNTAPIALALSFDATSITDITDARTWISNNKPTLYSAINNPTDTTITDQTLIEQLDDIYYNAHAYKERTHIISSAAIGNMPLVIAAEVGEDNESTITNAGNYLSKPKITVYGSGDISLYINDMHVLQITLGDEGYITIDTAQMEAYKDTIDNLKNRLVIGDYSNARLKPGSNKIHFTGKVTKYVVEDYSRWL